MWVTILYDGLACLLSGLLICELCFYKKKTKVLSKFFDHPEVKWDKREPVVWFSSCPAPPGPPCGA